RKTGRPIQILREMGHESRTGFADDLSSRCADAELRLGEPDRRNRKRQVCGHHRGLWKSHCGRDRNGTSQVRNERWRDCTKRSGFSCRVAHTLVPSDLAKSSFRQDSFLLEIDRIATIARATSGVPRVRPFPLPRLASTKKCMAQI